MLGIIVSHKELLAGSLDQGKVQWLIWEQENQCVLPTLDPGKTLLERLEDIFDQSRKASWFSGTEDSPCPVVVTSCMHEDVSQLRVSVGSAMRTLEVKDFRLTHVDAFVWSFLSGVDALPESGEKAMILEGLGKVAMLYELEHRKGVELPAVEETGATYLFRAEKTSRRKLNGIGIDSGKEKLLATLVKEFSVAGISLDAETQTTLAEQISQQPLPSSFTLSRETGKVVLQAEASFQEDELGELMLGDYQALRPQLSAGVIDNAGIKEIWVAGEYFHHPKFLSFLKEECNLNSRLRHLEQGTQEEVFEVTLKGLYNRHSLILEAEAKKEEADLKKREAEEKKAAIAAELKVKDERDQLLREIKDTCTNPENREEYEQQFVAKGESLGIPDLVIKWNITEALSRVELVQVGEEIGLTVLSKETVSANGQQESKEASQESQKLSQVFGAEDKAEQTTSPQEEDPQKEEKKEEGVPQAKGETQEKRPKQKEPSARQESEKSKEVRSSPELQKEKSPEPALEPAGVSSGAGVATAVKNEVKTRPSKKRDQVSLENIFSFKDDLPDAEFISRKATFRQDSDVKVVRILSAGQTSNPEAVGNFRKVYDKELAYFGNMSQISESQDGMYYYRKYIEQQSLRDFGKRHGLANKKSIEELSSGDLKFILTLLKEVQELPVSHGNLTADNILIINKRKWNLSKDLEVKFVEFHSRDVSDEESIEQAHKALGVVIGEKVYLEFKEKFQL